MKLDVEFRITRMIEDFGENKIIVEYELINGNGEVLGDRQEIVFWKAYPMNVIDGEEVRPDIPNWFDMPIKYSRQMKGREQDAREAIGSFLQQA